MSDYQGEKLKEYLDYKRISVSTAAEVLGVTRQNVYQYFKSSNLARDTVNNIIDKFGIVETEIWSKDYNDIDNGIDNSLQTSGKNKKKPAGLIPFYNADFIAGNAELYYDDETIYPEYYMDVPEFSGSTAFRAYGDSMEPRIKSGNILFGKKLENWMSHVEYGQIYGITCKDGVRYLKYIRKHENKEYFLLKSANPDYDDMDIPKSDIKNVWLINGWIDKRT